MHPIIGCLLFAGAVVAATEGLSWYWVYSHPEYRRLLAQLEKAQALVQECKQDYRSKQADKKLKRAEDQCTVLQQRLASFQMRSTLLNTLITLGSYPILTAVYDNLIVARLPFEPFPMIRGLSHRGLAGEDWYDASSHLIFALGLMVLRVTIQKTMEWKGLKPWTPPGPSIFEMAEKQANSMVLN